MPRIWAWWVLSDGVLADLGLSDSTGPRLVGNPRPPVLASPLAVAECAIASVAACLTAASDLAWVLVVPRSRRATGFGVEGPRSDPVIAGPFGTRILSALGADVLRVDDPHRRELPPHTVDGVVGKASASLDAGTEDGRRALHRLLDESDVLVTGYRPLGSPAARLRPSGSRSDVVKLIWQRRRAG